MIILKFSDLAHKLGNKKIYILQSIFLKSNSSSIKNT